MDEKKDFKERIRKICGISDFGKSSKRLINKRKRINKKKFFRYKR